MLKTLLYLFCLSLPSLATPAPPAESVSEKSGCGFDDNLLLDERTLSQNSSDKCLEEGRGFGIGKLFKEDCELINEANCDTEENKNGEDDEDDDEDGEDDEDYEDDDDYEYSEDYEDTDDYEGADDYEEDEEDEDYADDEDCKEYEYNRYDKIMRNIREFKIGLINRIFGQ